MSKSPKFVQKSEEKKRYHQTYKTAYAQLNALQQKAIETIDGPVMVVAGPGTGKTQILATRIANILLKTDVAPHNVLALTFTESATKAMRDRLLSIIGEDAYYVSISTFHAFCSDVIQSNPQYFPFSREAEPLSDLERFSTVESIIQSESFQYIKPINSPAFYVRDCIDAIRDLKREGISPSDFRKMLDEESQTYEKEKPDLKDTEKKKRETQLNRNSEVLQVYILYQQRLQEMSRYDFEDMVSYTVEAFRKDEVLLQTYQERMQYILVDEYQDTNSAQNMVLQLLAQFWGDQANIFVVGDISQSLYRFQGASIENNLGFVKTYPKAKIFTLADNYRSSQLILDAATELIEKNTFTHKNVLARISKTTTKKDDKLVATQKLKNLPIRVAALSSDPMEYAFLAEEIHTLIKNGVNPNEIAVLYRNNADSLSIEDALAKWDIPYAIDSGTNVLDHPVILQLLTLFETILGMRNTEEDLDLFTLLSYEWTKLDQLDVLKVTRQAAVKKTSILEVIRGEELEKLALKHPDTLKEKIDQLIHWATLDAQVTFPQWFEMVINESGFLNWVLNGKHTVERMNALQSLFSETKKWSRSDHKLNLTTFLHTIQIMRDHHIGINEESIDLGTQSVKLTTAHSAKGLEWEYVFLARVFDGKWGNVRVHELIKLPDRILKNTKIEDKEKNEDERRLFYVALTRAKKQVTISYAKTSVNGNRSKAMTPSMFIEEIPQKYKETVNVLAFESRAQELLPKLLQPFVEKKLSIDEQTWLKNILEDFVLTPTALNTYLECAYKFKLNTLMKVPRAKQDYLAFGTAVHKALEVLFRSYMEKDTIPPKEYVIDQFGKALKKEILTEADYTKRLIQGEAVLSAYYDEYRAQFKKPLFLEKFIGYGWSKVYLDDIRLGGRIDKIEWIDPRKKTVAVIDYKTGQPKTRGEIEGKTASSDGNYRRQLLFYKLLTDLDRTFTATVEQGIFDFIEKDKRIGKFRREAFMLTKEELEELRELIRETMKKIRELEFPRTTHYTICERCEFNRHCWPMGIPKQQIQQLPLL